MTHDLATAHKAAGERYAAAAAELVAALVELAAIEHATPPSSTETFEAWVPEDLSQRLRHRTFLPNPPKVSGAAVIARRDILLNQAAA